MTIIGIDPGLSGALVALDDTGAIIGSRLMPLTSGKRREVDTAAVRDWLVALDSTVGLICIEEPAPSPGRTSVGGSKAIGIGFGKLLAVCELFAVPHERVFASKWQKAVLGIVKAGDSKKESLAYAKRRWPALNLTPGKRTKEHDGLADAACIAEWGRRLIVGSKGAA